MKPLHVVTYGDNEYNFSTGEQRTFRMYPTKRGPVYSVMHNGRSVYFGTDEARARSIFDAVWVKPMGI